MIELQNVTKSFYTKFVQTVALNDVNMNVFDGEFLAVMGPSGCGKSTLLSIIGLLDTIDSGNLSFDGTLVSDLKERELAKIRRNKIGYVFQNFNLLNNLSVLENVCLPLKQSSKSKKERVEIATTMLEQVDLGHRLKHIPPQLSGGQQQRVSIARALVNSPDLIMADEPTGNLDSALSKNILDILANINSKGTTIVMVTHSLQDAKKANRIVNMRDGQIEI